MEKSESLTVRLKIRIFSFIYKYKDQSIEILSSLEGIDTGLFPEYSHKDDADIQEKAPVFYIP